MDTCFRISTWDTPLRVNPNRTAGRYNDAGSPATQYFGLHPMTPWAEQMRAQDIKNIEQLEDLRLRIWAIKVDLTEATEITFSNAYRFEIEPEELVADDHAACRRLASRLREDPKAPKTIVVPSAALPGTRNVVIFGERVSVPFSWAPMDFTDLPTSIVAERSQPPDGLEQVVRFPGMPNPELNAWTNGAIYEFDDLVN